MKNPAPLYGDILDYFLDIVGRVHFRDQPKSIHLPEALLFNKPYLPLAELKTLKSMSLILQSVEKTDYSWLLSSSKDTLRVFQARVMEHTPPSLVKAFKDGLGSTIKRFVIHGPVHHFTASSHNIPELLPYCSNATEIGVDHEYDDLSGWISSVPKAVTCLRLLYYEYPFLERTLGEYGLLMEHIKAKEGGLLPNLKSLILDVRTSPRETTSEETVQTLRSACQSAGVTFSIIFQYG